MFVRLIRFLLKHDYANINYETTMGNNSKCQEDGSKDCGAWICHFVFWFLTAYLNGPKRDFARGTLLPSILPQDKKCALR